MVFHLKLKHDILIIIFQLFIITRKI
uniref:Uncharacterized protein n=1 Tax=Anguilla anguilla TaxID=7936 RepID=A0A0E9PKN3_ANGAN